MLTEKQVEAYKRAGYLKVESLFTPQEVEELNSEMNLIIDDWWGIVQFTGPMSTKQIDGENLCGLATMTPRCVPSGWRPKNLTIKPLLAV